VAARLVVVDRPEYDLDEIKARVDLRTVVTPGAPIRGGKPTKTRCLWHDDSDPSLHVYPDHLHCYGCGEHMDLLDFVGWKENLDVRKDFDRLLELLDAQYVGMLPAPPSLPPRKPPGAVPPNVAEYLHQRLGVRRAWFHRRGLTDKTIDEELLGYDRRAFAIPVWSVDGKLLTVRFRRDDDALGDDAEMHSKYWGMAGRNEVYLYNAKALRLVEVWRFVVICEGELDALRLYQEGIPTVSATNGVGAFHEGLVRQIRAVDPDKVITAYDQDEQGRVHGIRVARLFGVKGRVATWPREWGKDVTEVLQNRPVEELVMRLLEADWPSRLERYWQYTLRNGVWR
jgi:DNA primase